MPQLGGAPPKPKKPPKPTTSGSTYGSETAYTGSSQQQKAGNNKVQKKVARESAYNDNPFDFTAVKGGVQTGTGKGVKSVQKSMTKTINTPIEKAGGRGAKYETTALKQGTATKKARQDIKAGGGGGGGGGGKTVTRGGSVFTGGTSGGTSRTNRTGGVTRDGGGGSRTGGDRLGVPSTGDHVGAARVGGGFGGLRGGNSPGAPAFFDGGSAGGGGGTTGANPLAAGISNEDVRKMDMEDVLHGAKRKGRVRHERGTE
jgi:hypothetical protein